MDRRIAVINRFLSSLVIASGVTLIVAGMAVYTAPPVPGDATPVVVVRPTPTPDATPGGSSPPLASGSPTASAASATSPAATDPAATGSAGTAAPSSPASASASASAGAGGPSSSPAPSSASASPPPTVAPSPTPTPAPTPTPFQVSRASRIAIPSLDIDLPIVPPGGPDDYPLCDVAQFLSAYRQPGEIGTVYIYAHAREGMFLPLLEGSQRNDGAGMLGKLVSVYTQDGHKYVYEIFKVKRHAVDLSLANEIRPGEQRLVMQTSEGPRGTVPKLQVAARLLTVTRVPVDEANPRARPVDCS